jgi:hypothetical protein
MPLAALAATLALIPATVTGDLHALSVAEQAFGRPPCGIPRVEVSTPARYQRAHGTAYFDDGEPLAWADEDRCAIVINPNVARLAVRTAVKRCHVIVHEWGHLAGREHSENPRSVMFGEDFIIESRERVGKRWVWRTGGAFRPCYAVAGAD